MAKRKIYTQPIPEPTGREVWLNVFTAVSFSLGALAGAVVVAIL